MSARLFSQTPPARTGSPERGTDRRRVPALVAGFAVAGLVLTACTSNTPAPADSSAAAAPAAASDNDASGDTVVIGFSAPAADHGWMGAITEAAKAEAENYPDVELRVAEGTNDVSLQISQIETFINDGVDAIVLLPFDGAALTEIATEAMEAGIVVINVDREFSSPFAARATVLGDNYGMGVSAGTYICEQLGDNPDAVVAEIAGIDSLPLTQDRSQGFADALEGCGLDVDNRVAADFTIQGGESATANLLQAADRRHLEPRRRPGCRCPRGHRERRARRVLHGRRGWLGQRHEVDRGRRLGAPGDSRLPVHPGGRRHQDGAPRGPGEVGQRPRLARGPAPGAAVRARRDGRQRRAVPPVSLRVLTVRTTSRWGRRPGDRPHPCSKGVDDVG
jgi:ABC-type sugar transport system substrate-binding protein